MKNKIKIWLMLFFVVSQCFACDDTDVLTTRFTPVKLVGKLKSVTNKTDNSKTSFEYDASSGILTKIVYAGADSAATMAISRNESGKPAKCTIDINAKGKKYTLNREYIYGGEVLKEIKETQGEAKDYISEVYSFGGTGQLQQMTRYAYKNNQQQLINTLTFTWKGDNVTTTKDRSTKTFEEEDFAYDDKENPVPALYRESGLVGRTAQELSRNSTKAAVKLYAGDSKKYDNVYDGQAKLVQSTETSLLTNEWKTTGLYVYEYYKEKLD